MSVTCFRSFFLKLRKITWDTKAAILEKILKYEKVHFMKDMNELKRRNMDTYVVSFDIINGTEGDKTSGITWNLFLEILQYLKFSADPDINKIKIYFNRSPKLSPRRS